LRKKEQIEKLRLEVNSAAISPELFNPRASDFPTSTLSQQVPIRQLLRRPEIKLSSLLEILGKENGYSEEVLQQVEFMTKYEGYLKRQEHLVEKFRQMEAWQFPEDFDFSAIEALSKESREKLSLIRPQTLGQASRISGVRQADLTILLICLEKLKRNRQAVSRETVQE
ncbi:MAG: tRNA uridine-5-carboxymethylaminomethyl(34) synthesis enzyme MnmG, partial [Calditrichia bacterium]